MAKQPELSLSKDGRWLRVDWTYPPVPEPPFKDPIYSTYHPHGCYEDGISLTKDATAHFVYNLNSYVILRIICGTSRTQYPVYRAATLNEAKILARHLNERGKELRPNDDQKQKENPTMRQLIKPLNDVKIGEIFVPTTSEKPADGHGPTSMHVVVEKSGTARYFRWNSTGRWDPPTGYEPMYARIVDVSPMPEPIRWKMVEDVPEDDKTVGFRVSNGWVIGPEAIVSVGQVECYHITELEDGSAWCIDVGLRSGDDVTLYRCPTEAEAQASFDELVKRVVR